ncbi:MAG: hypothetical protein LBK95_07345 [Bifidobacteriaceae bacterium]|nr:hypothetical protein [Bifidobacteriaceae bacterium]
MSGLRALAVRGLSEPIYEALKETAREHGRSMEAEARHIITTAVAPEPHTLADLARQLPPADVPWVRATDPPRHVELA